MNEVNDGYAVYASTDGGDIGALLNVVRSGIKYLLFSRIAGELSFTLAEWSKFLHLSERTLQRYKKENKDFNPVYSERIMEIAFLYKKGVTVFGDSRKFDQWLELSNLSLGGVSPKGLLDSTSGIRLVQDELLRIEHGILA